jgi:hypothetical protein
MIRKRCAHEDSCHIYGWFKSSRDVVAAAARAVASAGLAPRRCGCAAAELGHGPCARPRRCRAVASLAGSRPGGAAVRRRRVATGRARARVAAAQSRRSGSRPGSAAVRRRRVATGRARARAAAAQSRRSGSRPGGAAVRRRRVATACARARAPLYMWLYSRRLIDVEMNLPRAVCFVLYTDPGPAQAQASLPASCQR